MSKEKIFIFDTTLRDGAQTQGVDFSIDDKLKIANALDALGIDTATPRGIRADLSRTALLQEGYDLLSNRDKIRQEGHKVNPELVSFFNSSLLGEIISKLKLSSIILTLPLQVFRLFELLPQSNQPYKKQLRASDRNHLCKLHQNL